MPNVVTVNSVAGLNAALASATAGETIDLAAGTYSGVKILNTNFSTPVTITSAQPGNQAVLVGLNVANSSGLSFSNLQLSSVGATDPYYAFRIANSSNLTFTGVNVHGASTVAPSAQISGFYVTYSSNVSFVNSQFSSMNAAITANNDQFVNISNNHFSALNKGGVEMGGSSNVNISGNDFSNFITSAGTHADAIQFYTAGTTTSASNISITGNVVNRGSGNAIQGIFVQDETGSLPYYNLTISHNTVLGGEQDSIYVHANVIGSLNVTDNLVASWAGLNTEGDGTPAAALATTFATTNFQGDISVIGVTSAQITEAGNTAQGYQSSAGLIQAPSGNATIGAVNPVTGALNLAIAVVAVAEGGKVVEFHSLAGSALAGDGGENLYLADVGVGSKAQQSVGAAGTTFVGSYGSLSINPNGSYTYVETAQGLTVGQTYSDNFTITVASAGGLATSSTLDFLITGSGTGDGNADTIVAGVGAETIQGFGAGSQLISGTGPDTFMFGGLYQSTPADQSLIKNFKAGDLIDLSAADPNFHIVARFDGQANELVISHLGTGNWEILGDTTGSGNANFEIHLLGVSTAYTITAADFHLASPVTTVAVSGSVGEFHQLNGNALTGDTGAHLYVAAAGVGSAAQQSVSAGGSVLTGLYGTLTVNPNGSYTYVETAQGLTVGQTYTDGFTTTIGNGNGPAATSTLNFVITGSGIGDGKADTIVAGAGVETIQGFGAGSTLTSGAAADTFLFGSVNQSTPTDQTLIKNFNSNDVIDVSAVDPSFHIVTKFDSHAHELVLSQIGTGNWEVLGDTTGSGVANFELHLMGVPTGYTLTAANFHL